MSQDHPAPAPSSGPTLLREATQSEALMVNLTHGVAAVLTRPNPLREKPNQDAATVFPVGPQEALLAVADGMGGTRKGGTAAGTLVSYLANRVPGTAPKLTMRAAILNCIENVNDYLLENVPDSGTTLAAVQIHEHTIRPYHIGDSAIMVVGQRGKLKLRTIAHSPVGLALEAGLLSEEQALHHPQRNLILNAVGFPEMRIELGPRIALALHDTLLLASDGLTDNVTLDEIIELSRTGPLDEVIESLARLAGERMLSIAPDGLSKPDDLTILAYRRSG